MRLKAIHSSGLLDISCMGYAEGLGFLPPVNIALQPNETITLPDTYYRVRNIQNAINDSLLEVLDYDGSAGGLVIHAELLETVSSSLIVKISHIDEVTGIVYFKPYDVANYQIEVYKYTKKEIGEHIHRHGRIYTDHIGKRYKVLYQLARSATSWEVPIKFISKTKRYFKFGFFNTATKARSPLCPMTVFTAVDDNHTKILLQG